VWLVEYLLGCGVCVVFRGSHPVLRFGGSSFPTTKPVERHLSPHFPKYGSVRVQGEKSGREEGTKE